VRWKTDKSFDNVHANPIPSNGNAPDPFFYFHAVSAVE
jgi:hypothetical protein